MRRRRSLPPWVEQAVVQRTPILWANEFWQPISAVTRPSSFHLQDVLLAERNWERFAGLLAGLFPALKASGGIIESAFQPVTALRTALMGEDAQAGHWWLKADHALPVVGSVKARGGFYEVLCHAEALSHRLGWLSPGDDPLRLLSASVREHLRQYQVSVGSTGNLGLSIGTIASALGFRTVVHMSQEAKPWKKARLRQHGVEVREHSGDYGEAVAQGRRESQADPRSYFVDDETSRLLFLGYSVAALRLQRQLENEGIHIDSEHPLFVYLPCGVGGAPGAITFGLRQLLGDSVHCFLAEPVGTPCMLMRLANLDDAPMSIQELSFDTSTEADGLAVGTASELVAPLMRRLASGVFTVSDDELLEDLYVLEHTEGIRIEPSAAAGLRGPHWLLHSEAGRRYCERHGLAHCMSQAIHILWTTGGDLVPTEEYQQFHERGRILHLRDA